MTVAAIAGLELSLPVKIPTNDWDFNKIVGGVQLTRTLEEAVESTRWAGEELVWWWVRSNGRVMTWFGVDCPLFTTGKKFKKFTLLLKCWPHIGLAVFGNYISVWHHKVL